MVTFRYDHTHLLSQDVDAAARWYCDMFGGQITWEGQFRGAKVYYVDVPGARLIVYGQLQDELPLPAALHPRFGLDHFGLAVDDLDAAVAELKSKGVRFVEEPYSPRPGLRIAFVEGPDRVRIEIAERKS
jgi:catechol 2,3-dioxygenase-like lactoylglutathione lyase family enzyme